MATEELVYVVLRLPGGHPEDAVSVIHVFDTEAEARRFCQRRANDNWLDKEADERKVARGQYVVHPTVMHRRKRNG